MKVLGGILAVLGALYGIMTIFNYARQGRLSQSEGWYDLLAVLAVAAIIFAIGLAMFLKKSKSETGGTQ